ncbi:MAG TPA: hypothetical protein VLZ81_00710, partial [Blastocatellia bacterium]|nr:hypothetical protein [Blastocatellia bacterium]
QLAGRIFDPLEQIVGVNVVQKSEWRQIAPFFRPVHSIDNQDAVVAQFVQAPDNRAPDHPRPAGDKNGFFCLSHHMGANTSVYCPRMIAKLKEKSKGSAFVIRVKDHSRTEHSERIKNLIRELPMVIASAQFPETSRGDFRPPTASDQDPNRQTMETAPY